MTDSGTLSSAFPHQLKETQFYWVSGASLFLLGMCSMTIQSYRDLDAWRLAMDYVVAIYTVTDRFPRDERFGLTAQLRRAAVAIPSNISEGHQQSTRAYLRYVVIAIGSIAECETQLEIARRLKYLTDLELTQPDALGNQVRQVLFGLRRSLRRTVRTRSE